MHILVSAFAALWLRILALLGECVRWQLSQQIQDADHSASFLPQYDFVATPENLNFRASYLKPKCQTAFPTGVTDANECDLGHSLLSALPVRWRESRTLRNSENCQGETPQA
jgi:hypothetical protein